MGDGTASTVVMLLRVGVLPACTGIRFNGSVGRTDRARRSAATVESVTGTHRYTVKQRQTGTLDVLRIQSSSLQTLCRRCQA